MSSLTERIQTASKPEEIENLLEEGKAYKYARTKTRNRWKRFADNRIIALTKKEEKTEKKSDKKQSGENK